MMQMAPQLESGLTLDTWPGPDSLTGQQAEACRRGPVNRRTPLQGGPGETTGSLVGTQTHPPRGRETV